MGNHSDMCVVCEREFMRRHRLAARFSVLIGAQLEHCVKEVYISGNIVSRIHIYIAWAALCYQALKAVEYHGEEKKA